MIAPIANWRCHAAAALICAVSVGPVAYDLFDRRLPFQRTSGYIVPPDPAPGDRITVQWQGTQTRICPGKIIRTIVDSQGKEHVIHPVPADYVRGEPGNFSRDFILPNAVAPGPASYFATSYFRCNWSHDLWPIKGEFPALKFMVRERSGGPGPQGVQGYQGVQGPQGLQGERGPAGP